MSSSVGWFWEEFVSCVVVVVDDDDDNDDSSGSLFSRLPLSSM